MRLLTYQMPDELLAIANAGEFDEFDLNEFFAASGVGVLVTFTPKDEVQKWLSIIRGSYAPQTVEAPNSGTKPPVPYPDVRLPPYSQHCLRFLHNVAASQTMAHLPPDPHTAWRRDSKVIAPD